MTRIRTLVVLAVLVGAAACTAAPTGPSVQSADPANAEVVAAPEATTTADEPEATSGETTGLMGSGG